jgi:hypothetical protein
MSFDKALTEALTTRDLDNDVDINVADALMEIALALHRLAAIHERAQERIAASAERFEMHMMNGGARPQ